MNVGRFEIKPTSNGGWMFNLIANNNQVICTSQVYSSEETCRKGIESVRTNALSPIEDQTSGAEVLRHPKFELYQDTAGEYRFRLKARNGEIIAASQGYVSKRGCLKGIRSIGAHGPDASVVFVRNG